MRYSKTPRPKKFNENTTNGIPTNVNPTNLVKKQPSCYYLNPESKQFTCDPCDPCQNSNLQNSIADLHYGWTSGCQGTVYTSLESTIGLFLDDSLDVNTDINLNI